MDVDAGRDGEGKRGSRHCRNVALKEDYEFDAKVCQCDSFEHIGRKEASRDILKEEIGVTVECLHIHHELSNRLSFALNGDNVDPIDNKPSRLAT